MNNLQKIYLILTCFTTMHMMNATEIFPFFLPYDNNTTLEGYFSPPATPSSPIIFAIQGSSCESAAQWHLDLSNHLNALGLGLITLEKQGISYNKIDLSEYQQTNSLQKRLQDYLFCIENISLITPQWNGQIIFWGESEGGILAAQLASYKPETAALLLFATGGGMKPRDEVKWTLRHFLEEQGAFEEEVNDYMYFLDGQIEMMLLDPTPNKEFLGNTYQWWASLLSTDAASTFLQQSSLPIYLVHGTADKQIPLQSADLAATALKENHAVTYLRLENYGHNLNTTSIQASACEWLQSILLGKEFTTEDLIPINDISTEVASITDWRTSIADYRLSLGKGEISATAEVQRDNNGNESVSGKIDVFQEYDSGTRFGGSVEANAKRDDSGHVQTEVKAGVSASIPF